MDKIDSQILRLKSPDKNIRYDACKQLGIAPNLSQDAITALEQASDDPDTAVAHAARRALLAHRQDETPNDSPNTPSTPKLIPEKKPGTTKKKTDWVSIAVFFIMFLAIVGESTKLTCSRIEAGGQVDCVKQVRLLGVISVAIVTIRDVRGARMESWTWDERENYRVDLLTADGYSPNNSIRLGSLSETRNAVNKIDTFVRGASVGPLVVTDPGMRNVENFICFSVLSLIVLFGYYFWKAIK